MGAQTLRLRFQAGNLQLSLLGSVAQEERRAGACGAQGAAARAQLDCKAGSYWVCREGFGVKAMFLPSAGPFPSSRTVTVNVQLQTALLSSLHGWGRKRCLRAPGPTPVLNHPQSAAQHPAQRAFQYP